MHSTLIFVLLTPDDSIIHSRRQKKEIRRARQNVIFEMGYFVGMLGRKSGRIILLYKPPLELPSDLKGIIYIDVSKGIEAIGEDIRREVKNVSN